MKEEKIFYICSHTHWDREWYGSFQEFRFRLVKLFDKLFKILENDKDFKCFNLDGQTVVLEDYLEIYPENKDKIKQYVKEGRITVGPWYVLADEFLVSGESLIKNLLIGRKIANEFGKSLNVGYLPDLFGHISQMPQILNQFGIDTTIFWRGIDVEKEHKYELIWESPDGSKLLAVRLPGAIGYGNLSFVAMLIPSVLQREIFTKYNNDGTNEVTEIEDRIKIVEYWMKEMSENSNTNVFLLLNGIDHKEPDEKITKLINILNEKYKEKGIIFKHSSLEDFFYSLKNNIDMSKLDIIEGTQRNTYFYETQGGIVLNSVLSSRIDNKIFNRKAERLLEYYTNPSMLLSKLIFNKNYKAFIERAYKWLLKNHPHDSIGGCSIDEVHRQMTTRFEWAYEIGDRVYGDILNNIGEYVKIKHNIKEDEILFGVFNPLPYKREEVVEIKIPVPVELFPKVLRSVKVYDITNDKQINSRLIEYSKVAEDVDAYWSDNRFAPIYRARWVKVIVDDNFPAFGFKFYKLKLNNKPIFEEELISKEINTLENENLKVKIEDDGSLTVVNKRDGERYERINYFEDRGDKGDGYTYSHLLKDEIYTTINSKAKVSLIENNEMRGIYKVEYELEIPEGIGWDREHRSERKVKQEIISYVSLSRGERYVRIRSVIKNRAKDHRIRIGFGSGIKVEESFGEQAFYIERNKVKVEQPREEIWIENQPTEYSLQKICGVRDERRGIAIFSKDLPEYSVDEEGNIYLTLIRSVGWLGVDDLHSREGNAGPMIRTPEGQLLGKEIEVEYGIYPMGRGESMGETYREAEKYVVGSRGIITSKWKYKEKEGVNVDNILIGEDYIEVEGEVGYSTLKVSEEEENLYIMRLWNLCGERKEVKIRINDKVAKEVEGIYLMDLKEEVRDSLEIKGNEAEIEIEGYKILSLGVKLNY